MSSPFEIYLRTGLRIPAPAALETKFNPWHDPDDGRFTFAGQGRYFPGGSALSSAKKRLVAPSALKIAATKLKRGESRLMDVGSLKVVQFGPGVQMIPVAAASVEEFSAATAQASRMLKLDAVITGPQFGIAQGSAGLQGQVVVNGRIMGNSSRGLYYAATAEGADGIARLTFGQGDPPATDVGTGFGGAVPLLMGGRSVEGYGRAWRRYSKSDGIGKNILAYNSKSNTAALFVQPHGRTGYALRTLRSYIRAAGYDYAVMFDGSGSTSLRYKGKAIVSPDVGREPFIPLGIGFKLPGN